MQHLRGSQAADLSGKRLQDEGLCYICEAIAFNDRWAHGVFAGQTVATLPWQGLAWCALRLTPDFLQNMLTAIWPNGGCTAVPPAHAELCQTCMQPWLLQPCSELPCSNMCPLSQACLRPGHAPAATAYCSSAPLHSASLCKRWGCSVLVGGGVSWWFRSLTVASQLTTPGEWQLRHRRTCITPGFRVWGAPRLWEGSSWLSQAAAASYDVAVQALVAATWGKRCSSGASVGPPQTAVHLPGLELMSIGAAVCMTVMGTAEKSSKCSLLCFCSTLGRLRDV